MKANLLERIASVSELANQLLVVHKELTDRLSKSNSDKDKLDNGILSRITVLISGVERELRAALQQFKEATILLDQAPQGA